MWRAAGWAGTDKRTSSPSVLVTADKSKPLKFNGGHAAERGVCGYVCVCRSCGFTGAGGCHTRAFKQWDVITMLIKSTAYLMCDGSGSHWTSGKGIRPISFFFVAKGCLGWIPLLWSCWPPRILWFQWFQSSQLLNCLKRSRLPTFLLQWLLTMSPFSSLSSCLCSSSSSIPRFISLPSPQGCGMNWKHYWSKEHQVLLW